MWWRMKTTLLTARGYYGAQAWVEAPADSCDPVKDCLPGEGIF